MKTKTYLAKHLIIVFTGLVIFIAGCYQFDFVIQPHSAELNSSFEVQISVTMNDWRNNYKNYIGYFGIQLPEGWVVNDSIQYESDTNVGYFIYSSEMTLQVNNYFPPKEGYSWWVAESSDSVMYVEDDTFLFNPVINTSNDPGNYNITYYIFDSGNGMTGEYGNIWSYNNYITVGLPELVTVTNNNDSGPGSLRSAIDSVDFYGTITFDLDANDTLSLESQINVYKDVRISGDESQPVILSGNDTTRIFIIESGSSPTLSDLVITRGKTGNQFPYEDGGGIYVNSNTTPVLKNLLICENYASRTGGGIFFGDNCTAYLENITIVNNEAEIYSGGGMCARNCELDFDSINRCTIYDNISPEGNDIYYTNNNKIFLDTFSVRYPTIYYVAGNPKFTFDIRHGKHEQLDSDIYVSPDGNDNNNGVTPENPLKRINKALSLIRADSLHRNTIHLFNGVYSKSTTGEGFPLFIPDYVDLEGASADEVIINSFEGSQRYIYGPVYLTGNQYNQISKLTLRGGYWGGGITITNSSPLLNELIICENSGYNNIGGGGISCTNSNPTIENVKIFNNSGSGIYLDNSDAHIVNANLSNNTAITGGGLYCYNSNPQLINVTISRNNVPEYYGGGGGIYCEENSNPELLNTILWENEPQEISFYGSYNTNSISISYSDIEGGSSGIQTNNNGTIYWLEGNINEDPLFLGSGNHPYQLSLGSPCIDSGTPDTASLNLPEGDILGNLRIWDGNGDSEARIDMGAYEFQSVPVAVKEGVISRNPLGLNCYPNPFINFTTIEYKLSKPEMIVVTLFNSLGQKTMVLVNEFQGEGMHQLKWDTGNLPPGFYLIRLQIGNEAITKKIIKVQ